MLHLRALAPRPETAQYQQAKRHTAAHERSGPALSKTWRLVCAPAGGLLAEPDQPARAASFTTAQGNTSEEPLTWR